MGKKLIIKGADFFVNSIQDVDYVQSQLYQGLTITNPANANWGLLILSNFSTYNDLYKCGLITKIKIPANKSAKIIISNGNGSISDIPSGAVVSLSDIAVVTNTRIPSPISSLNVYPVSISMVQSDGSYLYTNNTNSDSYFYIIWMYNSTTLLPVEGKTCYYAII